jgi:hypothetical protein
MAPLVEVLVASAKSIAIRKAQEFVKQKVIERWSQYRAEKFFEAFLGEVAKQADDRYQLASLDELLEKLSEKDEATSALFDAYRRVCLSASKDIGPCVIGLLTAEIVLQERLATDGEEQMFQAAELLNDTDFRQFVEYTRTRQAQLTDEQRKQFEQQGYVSYNVDEYLDEVETEGGHFISLPPPNLGEVLGVWGLRLGGLCLLGTERRERTRIARADSERHRDQDMHVRTVEDYVVTTPEYHRLATLAERALALHGLGQGSVQINSMTTAGSHRTRGA